MLIGDALGQGRAILFVHGFPLDRWMWHHQVANLGGFLRLAPDLPGLGETPAPPGPITVALYARQLASWLDHVGVDSVVLCGLSMGGYVAFECLRQWPERVAGLVLMDTRADADTAEGRDARDRLIADVRARGSIAAADAMMPRLVGKTTLASGPAWLAELRSRIERTPENGVVGALEAMKTRPDSSALLSAIRVPTLVLVGAEDVITPPPLAEAMAASIPGAALTIVPGAGHLPPLERPEQVTEALATFLRRVM
jgi:pimeloyl-ACP methyl ester carboxylesterase